MLRKVTEDITPDYPDLTQLIQNMWDTLAESEGIGLAAPQIGLPIRLSVIDLRPLADDMPEYRFPRVQRFQKDLYQPAYR